MAADHEVCWGVTGVLGRTSEIRGLVLDAGTELMLDLDTFAVRATLAEDKCLFGITYPKGTLLVLPRWNLFDCALCLLSLGSYQLPAFEATLAQTTVVLGVPIAAKSVVTASVKGEVEEVWLHEAATFGKLGFKQGSRIKFSDGTIHWAHILNDQEVQGVPCRGMNPAVPWINFGAVHFYPDGRLKEAHLADEWSQRGRTYPAGSWLRFDRAGQVVRAKLPDDQKESE
jgi:hypothetical protein